MSNLGQTHSDSVEDAPEVEGGSIAGAVTDFAGVPLVGVRVEAAAAGGGDLDLLPVITDGDGQFRVEGLAEGRYDLRFVLGRVKARTLAVPVGTDQLRVKLARPQGILIVLKTVAGMDLPDLTHFVLERETPVKRVREHIGTMLRSSLLLWSIRPGRYRLTVWGGPYLPITVSGIDVIEKMPAPEVEVLFSAVGGAIEGRVEHAEGSRFSALVSWRRLDAEGHVPHHLTTLRTDPHGRFHVRGLPTGRYLLSGYHEQHGLGEVEAAVEEDATVEATLVLA